MRIMLFWSLLVPTMSAAADISPDSVMELQPVQMDIDFVINRSDINPAFSDNAGSISAMDSLFSESSSDSTISIRSVSFRGAASPDGGLNLNRALSERRMNSLKNFVSGRHAPARLCPFSTRQRDSVEYIPIARRKPLHSQEASAYLK